jgi:hypothetical protein
VAFHTTFDGFVVLHAAFLHPTRRKHFEAELKRVGIDTFTVCETHRIGDEDARLKHYKQRANGLLSLTDGWLAAIDLAEASRWDSVVVMEDDIVFRKNFAELWAGVEDEVRKTEWGVLTLHRTPRPGENRFLVREPFSGTALMPLVHNTLTHCVIVHRRAYAEFRASLLTCIERGYPCDFFYGVFSWGNPMGLYATNRNLSGQAAGLASSLEANSIRKQNFYAMFRSGSWLECMLLNPFHANLRRLKRALSGPG